MPERRYYRKTFQKNKKGRKFGFFLKFFGVCFFAAVLSGLFLFFYYGKDLPRPEKFNERVFSQSSKIYDRTGQVLLYEIYGEEKRTVVPLEVIPQYLKEAVIATEDANFYHHFGIDLKGIARAIRSDLKIGSPVYGGSTIPQQLIRSTFLSNEKTISRKIREIVLALELDRRYPKDQILEWYLNQVPFGQNSYGVEAASQTYFKKPVANISLAQAAALAALIKAPSYLSPYGEHKEELEARKNYVLDQMAAKGFLNVAEAESAKKEEISFAETLQPIKAPYFTLWVKQQVENKYGEDFLKERGLKIYTSLDWDIQKIAEETVKEGIERNKTYNAYNGGLVAINPKNGEIIAMTVGTGDYYAPPYPKNCSSGKDCLFDPKFNVVIGTKESPGRQPGSAFKPFVYAVAFNKGYDASTTVTDDETNFGLWGDKEYTPKNYDEKFRGLVTLRQGLAQSLNIPSIKVLYLAGTENIIEPPLTINNFIGQEKVFVQGLKNSIKLAKEMGITTLDKPLSSYGPAIVLGGGEVKLLDITSAYGIFATGGLRVQPVSILKIEDSKGNIVEENKKTPQRVLSGNVAKLINDILTDNEARVPVFHPRSPLYFENYQVAVKTGTTQDYRDGWTIGYTSYVSVGVWVGNNDNTPTNKEPGVVLAAPIFHDFMEKVLPKYPK